MRKNEQVIYQPPEFPGLTLMARVYRVYLVVLLLIVLSIILLVIGRLQKSVG